METIQQVESSYHAINPVTFELEAIPKENIVPAQTEFVDGYRHIRTTLKGITVFSTDSQDPMLNYGLDVLNKEIELFVRTSHTGDCFKLSMHLTSIDHNLTQVLNNIDKFVQYEFRNNMLDNIEKLQDHMKTMPLAGTQDFHLKRVFSKLGELSEKVKSVPRTGNSDVYGDTIAYRDRMLNNRFNEQ